jgi:polysaccharide biosynthesis/export protein
MFRLPALIQPNAAVFGLVCILACFGLLTLSGCGPDPSTAQDIEAFNRAGPIEPILDTDKIIAAKSAVGDYTLDIGDRVDIYMPEVIGTMPDASGYVGAKNGTVQTRLDNNGFITLPLIGRLKVVGLTVRAAETKIQNAYYPRYFSAAPSAAIKIANYRTYQVRITGAVKEPGVYELRRDEMSVASILAKAKGVKDAGAGIIRLTPAVAPGSSEKPTVTMLPVKDMDVPYVDAKLEPGMTVAVEQLPRRKITVMGLVNKPGVYDYPVDIEYNVGQAIGLGGGQITTADPQRATVYRIDDKGNLVYVTFAIGGDDTIEYGNVMLKPGDVVILQPSIYTTLRELIPQLLRVTAGMSIGG